MADAATARERTGLAVPEVSELPEGVTGDPAYQAAGVVSATFTFSAEKAAQAAAAEGEVLPPPPAGLDGSPLRIQAGPGVAAIWSQPTGVPTLVVARVGRAHGGLLGRAVRDGARLPAVPARACPTVSPTSCATSPTDGGTLPLPVPAELVTTSTADVDGVEATVLTSRDGLFAGVVWVEDGVMTGVAGIAERRRAPVGRP